MEQHEFKNGDKVRFLREDKEPGPYKYVGPYPALPSAAVIMQCGSHRFSSAFLSELEHYKEPVKVSGWVNVYERPEAYGRVSQDLIGPYDSKEAAEIAAQVKVGAPYGPVACIYVSGTEGVEPE